MAVACFHLLLAEVSPVGAGSVTWTMVVGVLQVNGTGRSDKLANGSLSRPTGNLHLAELWTWYCDDLFILTENLTV